MKITNLDMDRILGGLDEIKGMINDLSARVRMEGSPIGPGKEAQNRVEIKNLGRKIAMSPGRKTKIKRGVKS
jgi:hypothetical protein